MLCLQSIMFLSCFAIQCNVCTVVSFVMSQMHTCTDYCLHFCFLFFLFFLFFPGTVYIGLSDDLCQLSYLYQTCGNALDYMYSRCFVLIQFHVRSDGNM